MKLYCYSINQTNSILNRQYCSCSVSDWYLSMKLLCTGHLHMMMIMYKHLFIFLSSYICRGQPGCTEAIRHYPVCSTSAELAIYPGKFKVAMETTVADHLAQCCRPLALSFYLSVFPLFLCIKVEKNRARKSAGEVAKMESRHRCCSLPLGGGNVSLLIP